MRLPLNVCSITDYTTNMQLVLHYECIKQGHLRMGPNYFFHVMGSVSKFYSSVNMWYPSLVWPTPYPKRREKSGQPKPEW